MASCVCRDKDGDEEWELPELSQESSSFLEAKANGQSDLIIESANSANRQKI